MTNTAEASAQWHLGAGLASIHSGSRTGGFAAAGFLWDLDGRGILRMGGVASIGTADQGYATLQGNVELNPIPTAQVSPFVATQAGFLGEPEFSGGVLTGVAGVRLALLERLGIRVSGGWSTHGDRPGPNFILVALEFGGRGS